jgi:hypothetical protein
MTSYNARLLIALRNIVWAFLFIAGVGACAYIILQGKP